jgi:hypothetical protein
MLASHYDWLGSLLFKLFSELFGSQNLEDVLNGLTYVLIYQKQNN